MIRQEIVFEIRHIGVMRVGAIEDEDAVVVVASYRSVLRNTVRFKALHHINCQFRNHLNIIIVDHVTI